MQPPAPSSAHHYPASSRPVPRRPPPPSTAAHFTRQPPPHFAAQHPTRPAAPAQWQAPAGPIQLQAPPIPAPRVHPEVIDLTLPDQVSESLSSAHPLHPPAYPHHSPFEQEELFGEALDYGYDWLATDGLVPQLPDRPMHRVVGPTGSVEQPSLSRAGTSSGNHTPWPWDAPQATVVTPTPAPATKTAPKRKRKAEDDDPAGTTESASVAGKAPAKRQKTGGKRTKKAPAVAIAQRTNVQVGPARQPEPVPISKQPVLAATSKVSLLSSATITAPSRPATPGFWKWKIEAPPRPPLPPHLAGVIIASEIDFLALGRAEDHGPRTSNLEVPAMSKTAATSLAVVATEAARGLSRTPVPPPVIAAPVLAMEPLGRSKPQSPISADLGRPTDSLPAVPEAADDEGSEFDDLFGPDPLMANEAAASSPRCI